MSELEKEQETKLCRSYTYGYETRPVVFGSCHFEQTIKDSPFYKQSNDLHFSLGSENKYKFFLTIEFDAYGGIVITLNSENSFKNHVFLDVSLYLKCHGDIYEFPISSEIVISPPFASFSLKFEELKNRLKRYDRFHDFTVGCKVSVANLIYSTEDVQEKEQLLKSTHENIIVTSNHRKSVLNDDSFKDFTFFVQDETFHVSKAILALESPVFATMFKSKMSEGLNSEVTITDTEPEIFLKMIKFIHEQKIDQADLEKMALQLFKVAHLYEINKLTHICTIFLHENLYFGNALEILSLADLYSIYPLKRKALRTIKDNFKLFKKSEVLTNLFKERPHLSIDLIEIYNDNIS